MEKLYSKSQASFCLAEVVVLVGLRLARLSRVPVQAIEFDRYLLSWSYHVELAADAGQRGAVARDYLAASHSFEPLKQLSLHRRLPALGQREAVYAPESG